jgi:5'-nucleotidase
VVDRPVTADALVQTTVVDPVQASINALAANVIGTSDVPLDGRRATIRTRESNLGNLISDAILWQAQQYAPGEGVNSPMIAFQNSGGIRNNSILPAGDFTELNTFQVAPFSNFLSVLEDLPIGLLKMALEHSVSAALASPDGTLVQEGRFLQISGFEFTYNPFAPVGSRVRDLTYDGTLLIDEGVILDPSFTFDVATVNFTAAGGDGFDFDGDGDPTTLFPFTTFADGVTYQQALLNYIAETGGIGTLQALSGVITAAEYGGPEGRITAVPEPGTISLLGLSALVGVILIRRARLKSASEGRARSAGV